MMSEISFLQTSQDRFFHMENKRLLDRLKNYLQNISTVYEPFYEPGCESTDPKTGKIVILQDDGSWKEIDDIQ